jgi:hypothetical protein
MSSVQNGEPLAEREVLESKLGVEPQGSQNERKEAQNHHDRGQEVSGPEVRKVNRFNAA